MCASFFLIVTLSFQFYRKLHKTHYCEESLLNFRTQTARLSNEPAKMGRVGQDVHFHHEGSVFRLNASRSFGHQLGSHELDAQAMRNILTQLFAKTVDTKKKQKENQHHHYEAVFREATNIDKPPTTKYPGDMILQDQFLHPINRFNDAEMSESSTKCVLNY